MKMVGELHAKEKGYGYRVDGTELASEGIEFPRRWQWNDTRE